MRGQSAILWENPWAHHLPKRLITWRRATWFAWSFNDGEVVGTRSRVERALPLSTVIIWLGTRYLRTTRRLLTWIDSTLFPVGKRKERKKKCSRGKSREAMDILSSCVSRENAYSSRAHIVDFESRVDFLDILQSWTNCYIMFHI